MCTNENNLKFQKFSGGGPPDSPLTAARRQRKERNVGYGKKGLVGGERKRKGMGGKGRVG